jgi:hypothetical protein
LKVAFVFGLVVVTTRPMGYLVTHSLGRVEDGYLFFHMLINIVSFTAAELRIEELEKELLKVHQQMLDHLSDSQVINLHYTLLNATTQWLASPHFQLVPNLFLGLEADCPNF